MSNNEEQTKDEAAGAEQSSSAPPLSDATVINKALIAKLIDKTDGPMKLRMRRKNKNKCGQRALIEISDEESASSGQSSPAPNGPKPFEKSNVLYDKRCVKKYKQEKEDWWRDDEEEREKRPPRGDPSAKN